MSVLDFTQTSNRNQTAKTQADRPKAQLWLNIGYVKPGVREDGSDEFISLPQGIPLDGVEALKTNSSNDYFRALQAARNDLLEQLSNAAAALAPGEDRIIAMGDNGLGIQIRRVREEAVAPTADQNALVTRLAL